MKPRILLVIGDDRARAAIRNSRFIEGHLHRVFAPDLAAAMTALQDQTRTVAILVVDRHDERFARGFSSLDRQPTLIAFGDKQVPADRTTPRAADVAELEQLLRAELARMQ